MPNLEKYTDEELFEIFDANIEEEIKSRGYEFGWHKKIEYAGEIYILVNPAFPNLVKIGYANDVEKRVKSFNRNSGLPDPYHVYATYKVKKRLEDLKLHNLIDSLDSDLRHSQNREFYEMTPEKAYEILSAIAQINGDEDLLVKNPMNDEFFDDKKIIQTEAETEHAKPIRQGMVPNGIYYMRKKIKRWGNQFATGIMEVKDGKYIVKKGSVCCPIRGNCWTSTKIIDESRRKCSIIDNVLQEDAIFNSPSMAASMVTWTPEDGWKNWKTEDGKPLNSFRTTGIE